MNTESPSAIELAVEQLIKKSIDFNSPEDMNNAMTAFIRGVSTIGAAANHICDPDQSPKKTAYNVQHSSTIFDAVSDIVWLCDENSLKNSPEQLDELFVRLDKLLYTKMQSFDISKAIFDPHSHPEAAAFLDKVMFVARRTYIQAYLRISIAPMAHMISEELWDSILHEFYEHVQIASSEKLNEIVTRLTQMFPQVKGGKR
ncbi:MAG: hypothetical protein EBR82_37485 [Caulobacteraceae bacterium]|nr:hypothetical protein [Caulobacteraceae bacterium]